MSKRRGLLPFAFGGFIVLAGMIAAALWVKPWASEAISEEAAIQYTCSTIKTTPYDTSTTINRADGTTTIESRYSGKDSHHVFTITDANGVVTRKTEQLMKDMVFYTRTTLDGNASAFGSWSSHGPFTSAADHLPCIGQPAAAQAQSRSTGASIREQHITATIQLGSGEGTETREMWTNANGQPLRMRRTWSAGGVADLTFSGFGTPNTITAPQVGSQSGGNAGS